MRRFAVVLIFASRPAMSVFPRIAQVNDAHGPESDSHDEMPGLHHPETCDQFAPPVLFRASGITPQVGMFTPRLPPPLMLAGLLSAARTGLCIAPWQLNLWRDFSRALMNFSLQSAGMLQKSGAKNETLLNRLDKVAAVAETKATEVTARRTTIPALKTELRPVQIQRMARLHSVRDHHIWSSRGNATHSRSCPVAYGD